MHHPLIKGSSLGANDLQVILDYKLFHPYKTHEMAFLHRIVTAKRLELLKHPICESFLHMKWFRVRKYFYLYVMMYLVFLLSINCMVMLDLSPMLEGKFYCLFKKLGLLFLTDNSKTTKATHTKYASLESLKPQLSRNVRNTFVT